MAWGFVSFTQAPSWAVCTLATVFIFCVLHYFRILLGFIYKEWNIARGLKAFPSPPRHWLWGNLHQVPGFNEDGIRWIMKWIKKYPRAICVWVGPRPVLITCHPETCKLVMKSSEPKHLHDKGAYSFVRPWMGDGLVLSTGAKWVRNRKLIMAGFHFDVIKSYMGIYNRAGDILMSKLGDASVPPPGVNVFHRASLCTLDVLMKCAFSSDMDVQNIGESHPYVDAMTTMSDHLIQRCMNPLLYPDLIYKLSPPGKKFYKVLKTLHQISSDVIMRRRKALNDSPGSEKKANRDFLDLLILAKDEDGKSLNDSEIQDEVNTFLFAGHDTTASVLAWTLYLLAKHTEHQEKCYRETHEILGERTPCDVEWNDLKDFPHLTMCIKEAMRLYTPVPIIGREIVKGLQIDGVDIPRGTFICIGIHGMHHNPSVWGEDHREFKPERFEEESQAQRDAFSFAPFSAGPRNCVGQAFAMSELRVILTKIINRFTMSVHPSFKPKVSPGTTMKSNNGIHIIFKERIPN